MSAVTCELLQVTRRECWALGLANATGLTGTPQ